MHRFAVWSPIAGDTDSVSYRLVVFASKRGRKNFGWAIVREADNEFVPLRQSLKPFSSMEDAHAAGSVALHDFRSEQAQSAKRK
jgi:hypothetical protein